MQVVVCISLIVFDFITGILCAFKQHKFNSTIMREGGFHKLGNLLAICLGVGIDYAQGYLDLGYIIPTTKAICVYIALMEIGSIIENIGLINPKLVPSKLRSIFVKIPTKGE